MTTPDERYALAEQVVLDLKRIATDLKSIGYFTQVENQAVSTLLMSAGIAMNILDPDKYTVFLDAWYPKTAEHEQSGTLGQYL